MNKKKFYAICIKEYKSELSIGSIYEFIITPEGNYWWLKSNGSKNGFSNYKENPTYSKDQFDKYLKIMPSSIESITEPETFQIW
jgi:hypothetical protein